MSGSVAEAVSPDDSRRRIPLTSWLRSFSLGRSRTIKITSPALVTVAKLGIGSEERRVGRVTLCSFIILEDLRKVPCFHQKFV
jgi:hypothetical protein